METGGLDALGDLIERERELVTLRAKLDPLLDGFEIVGPIRADMLADPERALRICERVLNSRGVRKPGALAITLWRQSSAQLTQTAAPVAPEPEPGPPSLSAIEYAWSRDSEGAADHEAWRLMMDGLLGAMAAAIAEAGGFAAIRPSFAERELYDSDGNLIARSEA